MGIGEQIERRPVLALTAYAQNARTHSEEQVAQIARSIEEFGFTIPVLIDRDGMIIAGHGRVLAAKKLKMADVPVIVASGWSEAQKRAYVLADNKLALDSGWDTDLLMKELQSLDGDFRSLTGFTDEDFDMLADLGKVSLDEEPPDGVEANAKHIEEIRAQRKLGNDATAEKNDTERYLVLVYATREARENAVRSLGLPEDERYVDAAAVSLTSRFGVAAKVKTSRSSTAASRKKSGAGG